MQGFGYLLLVNNTIERKQKRRHTQINKKASESIARYKTNCNLEGHCGKKDEQKF